MNPAPKVSVMMALYNNASYLAEAVESVLSQSFKDIELLIYNDGSTDDGLAVAKSYATQDERVRVMSSTLNRGARYAMAKLLENADGEYLMVTDADDVVLPGKIKAQVDYLDQNHVVGALGTWSETVDEQGTVTGVLKQFNHTLSDKQIKEKSLLGVRLLFATLMYRKSTVNDHKLGFGEEMEMGFDDLFMVKLMGHTKTAVLPQVFYQYRQHSAQVTRTKALPNSSNYKVFLHNLVAANLENYGLEDVPRYQVAAFAKVEVGEHIDRSTLEGTRGLALKVLKARRVYEYQQRMMPTKVTKVFIGRHLKCALKFARRGRTPNIVSFAREYLKLVAAAPLEMLLYTFYTMYNKPLSLARRLD